MMVMPKSFDNQSAIPELKHDVTPFDYSLTKSSSSLPYSTY